MPVDVISLELTTSSAIREVTYSCAAALRFHQARGIRRSEVELSIYPFKYQKDLKGCSQVVEVIRRVHSGEGISIGREEDTKTEETEHEGMFE